ncbi:MAG: molybdopterin biosynthesis protein MoeA, partial [Actinomycetota bacterium]
MLAADAVAAEDVPPFANTAVDGYAVRAADTAGAARAPIRLRVTGEIAAGAAGDMTVEPGCAVRIMTGAPMPHGADAVVMVEDTAFEGDRAQFDGSQSVEIRREVAPGSGVRGAGDDVRAGATVF